MYKSTIFVSSKQTFSDIIVEFNFNSFRLTSANVKAIGKGMNTISLVKEAMAIRDIEKRRSRNYDQCWVVFDKDDFSDSDFNAAIAAKVYKCDTGK